MLLLNESYFKPFLLEGSSQSSAFIFVANFDKILG